MSDVDMRHLARADTETACVFGCGMPGVIDLSDARHEGLGFGCLGCIVRAARKKYVERLIKQERRDGFRLVQDE